MQTKTIAEWQAEVAAAVEAEGVAKKALDRAKAVVAAGAENRKDALTARDNVDLAEMEAGRATANRQTAEKSLRAAEEAVRAAELAKARHMDVPAVVKARDRVPRAVAQEEEARAESIRADAGLRRNAEALVSLPLDIAAHEAKIAALRADDALRVARAELAAALFAADLADGDADAVAMNIRPQLEPLAEEKARLDARLAEIGKTIAERIAGAAAASVRLASRRAALGDPAPVSVNGLRTWAALCELARQRVASEPIDPSRVLLAATGYSTADGEDLTEEGKIEFAITGIVRLKQKNRGRIEVLERDLITLRQRLAVEKKAADETRKEREAWARSRGHSQPSKKGSESGDEGALVGVK